MTYNEYIDQAYAEFDKGNLAKAELLLKFADIAAYRERTELIRKNQTSGGVARVQLFR